MQRDVPALALVRHRHFQSKNVSELTFERRQVGVHGFRRVARAGTPDIGSGPGRVPCLLRTILGLTHRLAARYDLLRQRLRVGRRGDRTRMPHGDVARDQ